MCLTRRAVDTAGIKKIYSYFRQHRYRSLLRVLFMDPELSSTRRTGVLAIKDTSFQGHLLQGQQHQALERNEDGLSHNVEEVTRVVHLHRTRTKLLNTTLSVWIWNMGCGTFHMNYLFP